MYMRAKVGLLQHIVTICSPTHHDSMGHRNLSRERGSLVVFICKVVVYDVNKAFR